MSVKKRPTLTPLIVITRPKEDAHLLAKEIKALGFQPFIEPILTIKILTKNKAELKKQLAQKPQAILATSKHAIHALALMSKERSLPLIVVGAATSKYAKTLGFTKVTIGGATAELMVSYIAKKPSPTKGTLLYARGKNITVDIAAKLARKKYKIESVTLYEAETSTTLSPAFCEALKAERISTVLFFSPRTAATYQTLAKKHALIKQHRKLTALCMSAAIAKELKGLPWKKILVSPAPTQQSMLKLLTEI